MVLMVYVLLKNATEMSFVLLRVIISDLRRKKGLKRTIINGHSKSINKFPNNNSGIFSSSNDSIYYLQKVGF